MTPEAQRIAIAEACGWRMCITPDWRKNFIKTPQSETILANNKIVDLIALYIPDYLNDLNAMHAAEKVIKSYGTFAVYMENLAKVCGYISSGERLTLKPDALPVQWYHLLWVQKSVVSATAAQRAEAFLRTLNLYTT